MVKKYIALFLTGIMVVSMVTVCKKKSNPADNESVSTTMEDIKEISKTENEEGANMDENETTSEPITEQSTENVDSATIENEAKVLAEGIINNIVDSSMTDFQKTMEIIKWMMFNLKMETGSQSLAYYDVKSAIDTLKSKVGTYTGYVSSFYLLANVAGVDTVYIIAREEDTFNDLIWVQVKLDNKWYNIDLLIFGKYMNLDKDITYKIRKCLDYVLISDNTLNSEKYWSEYKKECLEDYSKIKIMEFFSKYNDKSIIYGETYEEVAAGIQDMASKGIKTIDVIFLNNSAESISYDQYIVEKLVELGYVMRVSEATWSSGYYYANISVKELEVDVVNWYDVNNEDEFVELCKRKYEQHAQMIIVKISTGDGAEWAYVPIYKGYINGWERYQTPEYDFFIIYINPLWELQE